VSVVGVRPGVLQNALEKEPLLAPNVLANYAARQNGAKWNMAGGVNTTTSSKREHEA